MVANIDKWSKDEKVNGGWVWSIASPKVRKHPKGIVLVIGASNYPLNLSLVFFFSFIYCSFLHKRNSLVPFVGAIAGGNTVVLKPSELNRATAALITKLLPQYLDTNCYRVINGAKEQMVTVLKLKFNHIFFTGSGNVGKIVAEAAAKHLTPTTLELGGKCPSVVLGDADLRVTARRLLFGKIVNAGQVGLSFIDSFLKC